MARTTVRTPAVALLISVLLLGSLAACSSGDDDTSGTTTSAERTTAASTDTADTADGELPVLDDLVAPEYEPTTRSEELLADIAASDVVSVQQAVDLFDLAYGGMPGATPSDLPSGESPGESYAWAQITAVRDQLTADQQAVLDAIDESAEGSAVIPGPDGPDAPDVPGGTLGRSRPMARPNRTVAYFLPLATQVWRDWKAFRPELPLPIVRLEVMGANLPDGFGGMDASSDPLDPTRCRVRVFKKISTASEGVLKAYFAHEFFHCVQLQWSDLLGDPSWLVEGSADFAMADLYRNSATNRPDTVHQQWFEYPGRPLSWRQYDAWPLYESVKQIGIDPYPSIKAMFQAPTADVGPLLAAGGVGSLATQGGVSSRALRSTRFREPEWTLAPPWPSIPSPSDNYRTLGTRDVGTFLVTGNDRWGHMPYEVIMGPRVGIAEVTPLRTFLTTHTMRGTVTVAERAPARFCFDASGCICPSGQTSDTIPMDGRGMIFSFPGSEQSPGAGVVNREWDPEKECHESSRGGRGGYDGDPHLATFDGLPYDVMAPGEFVVSRDPDGGFEIQARNEPLGEFASYSSAVAFGSDEHRITFTAKGLDEAEAVVRVDGEVIDPAAPPALTGMTLSPGDGSSTTVTWADGSRAELAWGVGWFITVLPAAERSARLVGLLGARNGNPLDDLQEPDGTVFEIGPEPDSDEVRAFSRTWLVDDDTTLFDYEPGESPETFASAPMPTPLDVIDDADLERCTAALGEDALPSEIEACAYDVGATGNDGYLDAYAQSVAGRVEWQTDGGATTDTSTSSTTMPPADGTSVELEGVLVASYGDTSGSNTETELTGSLALDAGAMIVARTRACRAGVSIDLTITRRSTGGSDGVDLCDSLGLRATSAGSDSEVTSGEGYMLVAADDDYDVTITTDAEEAFAVAVSVDADPSPTIVTTDDALAEGFSGTLDGIGDSAVLLLSTGSEGTTWNVTGAGEGICIGVPYAAPLPGDDADPWGIDACGQTVPVEVSPTSDETYLLVVFSRTDEATPVTIRR